ncbi:hypothetical protein GXY_04469 [Novacetimonas hansenii ATCC 23769]|uniref:Uncharacterized protein n=1 Tax=Novacetimonas hansenii ATCC 23769 TaxID=714995 RepID=D5QCP0_NOVHA|nr:hypothetical protein GXY_04469 [Novacetimonas hansenii ATCC 23769]
MRWVITLSQWNMDTIPAGPYVGVVRMTGDMRWVDHREVWIWFRAARLGILLS